MISSDVLGHRSFLVIAVLVVWLVLFHLLVNIWLLCVFTSLLVVLGGWLGSQAVLESNSLVRLERFVCLEQAPPSQENEQQLDQEIQNMVRKIIRDFVSSWYSTVSPERKFEMEVQSSMLAMAMELKARARQINRNALTQRTLELFGFHLQTYLRARELLSEQDRLADQQKKKKEEGEEEEEENRNDDRRLWRAYAKVGTPHPALKSLAVEANYARGIVDLLLQVLVPTPHLESRTGRFVVAELIFFNVLQPVIGRLSDPDWLNVLIGEAFTKPSKPPRVPEEPEEPAPSSSSSSPPSSPLPQPAGPPGGGRDVPPPSPAAEADGCPLTLRIQPATPSEEAAGAATPELADPEETPGAMDEDGPCTLRHFLRNRKANPFYQETDSDLDSPVGDSKRGSTDSLDTAGLSEGLSEPLRDCATPSESASAVSLEDDLQGYAAPAAGSHGPCPKALVHLGPPDRSDGTEDSSLGTAGGTLSTGSFNSHGEGSSSTADPDRGLLLGVERTGTAGGSNELSVTSPLQVSSPMGSFSFEPPSSPEGPVVIHNLRITGTITAKEHRGTGSHPYTLYTVLYETAMGCETPSSEAPSLAFHKVNRRYSEFLNLQTRLEEKPELRKILKNVKGPKKIIPDFPFGNMDSDRVEARKGLLETFLRQLCAIPETANSVEVQEFLALNTDARIAFVKKPFIVSRIDKLMVNAIVDTLKTAFPKSEPQSPTEDNESELDGGRLTVDKRSRSRLRFTGKQPLTPLVMNGADMRPQVLYCLEESSTVFNGMSLGGLKAFIMEQERLVYRPPGLDPDDARLPDADSPYGDTPSDCPRRQPRKEAASQEPVCETTLADVALNILCLVMREQWNWLCTENIMKTSRLLFGTLINRWLDVGVGNLMSIQSWVTYLRLLQEAVWPGGSLPSRPRQERSQQQKEQCKQNAVLCLMRLIPDLLSDMLGSDKYKLSWQTALESLQDPHINRHLVFSMWDLLLELLVPETSEEEFQGSLLHGLSRQTDRLLL
ncbi:sorting nexin-19 [Aplochiton taeniatus]